MKKKTILIFGIVSVLTVCVLSVLSLFLYKTIPPILYYAKIKEVLEYKYDFTSPRTLYNQFRNLGFKHSWPKDEIPDINFGFARLSMYGHPKFKDTYNGEFSDKDFILLDFMEVHPMEIPSFSKNDKNNIKNFLSRQYGKAEWVLMAGEDLPKTNSPVLRPDVPIERWELEDRYLYLNDYPDIDVFEIRMLMKYDL